MSVYVGLQDLVYFWRTTIYGITSEFHTTDKLEEPSEYVDYDINSVQIVIDRLED